MKKLAAMILVLVLALCCAAALAEEPDLSGADIAIPREPKLDLDLKLRETSLAPDPDADVVTFENNVYTVTAAGCTYELDLAEFPAFLCFTQDIYASFDAYLQSADPGSVLQFLLDYNIHFCIMDIETDLCIYIYSESPDSTSILIGDFTGLSERNQEIVASRVGADGVEKAGSLAWLLALESDYGTLSTVVNGYYIRVEFSGASINEDLEDTLALLAKLTVR